MMQFDSLFMIKVAESKGLFGEPDKERTPKQKADVPPAREAPRISRKSSKRAKVRIRIVVSTLVSFSKSRATIESLVRSSDFSLIQSESSTLNRRVNTFRFIYKTDIFAGVYKKKTKNPELMPRSS